MHSWRNIYYHKPVFHYDWGTESRQSSKRDLRDHETLKKLLNDREATRIFNFLRSDILSLTPPFSYPTGDCIILVLHNSHSLIIHLQDLSQSLETHMEIMYMYTEGCQGIPFCTAICNTSIISGHKYIPTNHLLFLDFHYYFYGPVQQIWQFFFFLEEQGILVY